MKTTTSSHLFIIWQLIIPCGYFVELWQCQINLLKYRVNKLASVRWHWPRSYRLFTFFLISFPNTIIYTNTNPVLSILWHRLALLFDMLCINTDTLTKLIDSIFHRVEKQKKNIFLWPSSSFAGARTLQQNRSISYYYKCRWKLVIDAGCMSCHAMPLNRELAHSAPYCSAAYHCQYIVVLSDSYHIV